MHDGPMILWILLMECNTDPNISFDAHYAVIENATLSKYKNDVNTLCTALKQAKSDIIGNGRTNPENMYKRLSIKALKSVLNAKFNKYICQKTNTWNETGDIRFYNFFQDCKRKYLNTGKDFCKTNPKDAAIIVLTTKSMKIFDKKISNEEKRPAYHQRWQW